MPLEWYQHLGTWVAAFLTLAIFSFLYRDNPIYKFAEHLFVGVAAGYTVAYSFWMVFYPNLWTPLVKGPEPGAQSDWLTPQFWRWMLLIPGFLGLLFFARFSPKSAWISRWSIAFLVGTYAGVNATAYFQADLLLQTEATFMNLNPAELQDGVTELLLWQIPIVLGVLATLTYFFFSKPHTGVIGGTARMGIWFLMAAFGASFGFTVMGRISLFIGRVYFLWEDWAQDYWRRLF